MIHLEAGQNFLHEPRHRLDQEILLLNTEANNFLQSPDINDLNLNIEHTSIMDLSIDHRFNKLNQPWCSRWR